MTAPYYPNLTWGEQAAEKQPKKQDTLSAVLGNRFQQTPNTAAPQQWTPQMPQGANMRAPQSSAQSSPQGGWPQSRQAGSPQPTNVTGVPPGSTPMQGAPPVTRVNPFRPAQLTGPMTGGLPQTGGADPGASQGGGNGYTVQDGRLTHSNYGHDLSSTRGYHPAVDGQPMQPIVEYDYSPGRSYNGYADLTDDEYRELVGLGEENVAGNFESYTADDGTTHWRYAAGAQGHSGNEHYYGGNAHDANGYPIDENGNRLVIPGQPVPPPRDSSSVDYGQYPSNGVSGNGSNVMTGAPGVTVTPGSGPMGARGARGSADGLRPATGGPAYLYGENPATRTRRYQDDANQEASDAYYNTQTANTSNDPRWGRVPVGPPHDIPEPPPAPPPATDQWTSNYRPPPAPYQPPNGGAYNFPDASYGGDMDALIQEMLSNPSRWDNPLIQSTWNEFSGDIDDQFDELGRGLEARLAQQGIRNSTPGVGEYLKLGDARRTAKSRSLRALEEDIANTMASDRSASINTALGASRGRFADQLSAADLDLRRRFGLDDRSYRDRESDWQHEFDTENFNADQQKWMDRFYQWMVEQGLV